MQQNKHEIIDARIIKAIAGGKRTFSPIVAACAIKAQVDDRQIDQRLQALKRKRVIVYTGGKVDQGWQLVGGGVLPAPKRSEP